MAPDWKGASSRIKGLISMSDKAQIANAAARLGVRESELRDAIDEKSRTATLKVIVAVVRVYGLDPTWVLTGNYNPSTHRVALQRDIGAIDELLRQLVGEAADSDGRAKPAAEQPQA